MIYLACVLIGILIGCIATFWIASSKSIGNLRLDHSDDEPYLFLELTKDFDCIYRKKFVLLKVKIENFVTRK